jgi:hypothetical protein
MGVQDEADQFGVSLGQCHPVKVDPRLGLKLTAGHLSVGLGIHLQGCLSQHLGGSRGEVPAFDDPRLFAKDERRNPRLGVMEGGRLRWGVRFRRARTRGVKGARRPGNRVPEVFFL